MSTIPQLQDRVGEINTANGWGEPIDPVIAELLAMQMPIVSEVRTGQGRTLKPEGVPSEIADIVIRCLDFADKYGIDLEAAIEEKLTYNQTRTYRHDGKRI